MPEADSLDGITTASLGALIALRARAGWFGQATSRVRDGRSGPHLSALRGRGMDYAESRIYEPGDDARNIDWRRTARSGKLHTKLFEEDRERACVVVLDAHAGMRFGTRVRYKSVAAARAAALAVWMAVRAGERVGALAFGPLRARVAPRAGTRGALRVLAALAQWSAWNPPADEAPGAEEPLSQALARTRRLAAPGSRVLLVSDGWCTDPDASRALAELARRRDVRVLIVADALERHAPPAGAYAFDTGSGRATLDLHGAAARAAFAEALGAGAHRLAEAAAHAGVRSDVLDTAAEPTGVVTRLWRQPGVRR